MAGHSKWANIKHRKDRADKIKGKLFSRLSKEIITAVKQGGPDPKANPRLRIVIQKAKTANYPNDNIERNIKKAASSDQADYAGVIYEFYGFGGVGIVAEALTDNKNRTATEMRIATNKRGGTIATPGSVLFNFDRKGIIQIAKKGIDGERLFLDALEGGAEDFEEVVEEGSYFLITAPEKLMQVKEKLEGSGYTIEQAELELIPKHYVESSGENAQSNLELIQWLGDLEDVDEVYHNMRVIGE